MIEVQANKTVVLCEPQAIVDNTDITCAGLDTANFANATLYFALGATDIAITAAKLQESTDNSTWADVTNGALAVMPSATDDNKLYAWDVPMKGSRKRYLKLVITVGNGTAGAYGVIWATLSRGQHTPDGNTERGLAQSVQVV